MIIIDKRYSIAIGLATAVAIVAACGRETKSASAPAAPKPVGPALTDLKKDTVPTNTTAKAFEPMDKVPYAGATELAPMPRVVLKPQFTRSEYRVGGPGPHGTWFVDSGQKGVVIQPNNESVPSDAEDLSGPHKQPPKSTKQESIVPDIVTERKLIDKNYNLEIAKKDFKGVYKLSRVWINHSRAYWGMKIFSKVRFQPNTVLEDPNIFVSFGAGNELDILTRENGYKTSQKSPFTFSNGEILSPSYIYPGFSKGEFKIVIEEASLHPKIDQLYGFSSSPNKVYEYQDLTGFAWRALTEKELAKPLEELRGKSE